MADEPRVVLVAGASRGIGRALVDRCRAHGDTVIALSRSAPDVAFEADVHHVLVDLLDAEATAAAARGAAEALGRLDATVYVAGVTLSGTVEESTGHEFDRVMGTNVRGAMHVARAALPVMRAAQRGLIVNVSSQSAHLPSPYFGLYGASKAALEHLTVSLDHEVRPFGIAARLVVPGGVRTGILDGDGHGAEAVAGHEPTESVYASALERQCRRARRAIAEGVEASVVAEAIVGVLRAEDPPMRTIVGEDALHSIAEGGVWPAASD
ncbi:SDR family NAD(P)-dependent oxidoreductase [Ilumatobacter coccineus]|uniref:Putative oxidoreductase n=1 Tax=Ilumatobacter coccineus (strain NBRC 103263 / KCTC 29153 / YM16-304) TaxID=1313172 RepID=A0A6C7E284_ILUCY|nr:SDR family NAD(P)-dependent oxidoreductase [Ilumatobacter coccineus]BAN00933.1 putative oxidoreductase [Ilumatobacter coccineus YM16-304]